MKKKVLQGVLLLLINVFIIFGIYSFFMLEKAFDSISMVPIDAGKIIDHFFSDSIAEYGDWENQYPILGAVFDNLEKRYVDKNGRITGFSFTLDDILCYGILVLIYEQDEVISVGVYNFARDYMSDEFDPSYAVCFYKGDDGVYVYNPFLCRLYFFENKGGHFLLEREVLPKTM